MECPFYIHGFALERTPGVLFLYMASHLKGHPVSFFYTWLRIGKQYLLDREGGWC